MRSLNEITIPEEFARCVAELTAQVADLSRRLAAIEKDRGISTLDQQADLTIEVRDDDRNAIEFHTENGFVIVRPWETGAGGEPANGSFRFSVQDPDGAERAITVEISNQLLAETALRTSGRIEQSSDFWICCAEQRLANYLMEHDAFPAANEMMIDKLEREDVLLAIRWGKTG